MRSRTSAFLKTISRAPDGGTLGVSAVCEGDIVFLQVKDAGMEIPEDLMPDLFKAFVTTKSKGMSLGLAYCKRAVELRDRGPHTRRRRLPIGIEHKITLNMHEPYLRHRIF